MNTCRVFISYSHDDKESVKSIVNILEENGLTPLWDQSFAFGHGFPEQIKNFIAHAHVFMPIISTASSKRGWVQQEIGYAMALNIPVLPVAIDRMPGEMLQELHAMQLSEKIDHRKKQLAFGIFDRLVVRAQRNTQPLFECAEHHEERTAMMVEYASKILELGQGYYGHVRQKGALSSFHIPDKHIGHPIWQQRHGVQPVSEFLCKLLREERRVLVKHAKEEGYSITIDPYLSFKKYGPLAKKVRLETLIDFLDKDTTPKEKVKVAINQGMPTGINLTIVGDWFAAESISATIGKGYQQTIFTRNAPSVRNRRDQFDKEMEDLFEAQQIKPIESRDEAIKTLKEILEDLNKNIRRSRRKNKE